MAYCLACRQNFERSPDGIEHVYNDGTHHSWCNKYTGDLAVTMGGRRPSLHSKPLDFSIAPGRERIMPAHRRSKTKLRRLERRLNVEKNVVLFRIGNVKLMK